MTAMPVPCASASLTMSGFDHTARHPVRYRKTSIGGSKPARWRIIGRAFADAAPERYRSVNRIPRRPIHLEEDGLGRWQWTVVLGSPPEIKSGHAPTKGTAIMKVWAAIDRVVGSRQFKKTAIGKAHAVTNFRRVSSPTVLGIVPRASDDRILAKAFLVHPDADSRLAPPFDPPRVGFFVGSIGMIE
jgi:hypothetical protein